MWRKAEYSTDRLGDLLLLLALLPGPFLSWAPVFLATMGERDLGGQEVMTATLVQSRSRGQEVKKQSRRSGSEDDSPHLSCPLPRLLSLETGLLSLLFLVSGALSRDLSLGEGRTHTKVTNTQ